MAKVDRQSHPDGTQLKWTRVTLGGQVAGGLVIGSPRPPRGSRPSGKDLDRHIPPKLNNV